MLLFYSVGRENKIKGNKNGSREEVSPPTAPPYYAARRITGFTPVRQQRSPPPLTPQLRREAHFRVRTGQAIQVQEKNKINEKKATKEATGRTK